MFVGWLASSFAGVVGVSGLEGVSYVGSVFVSAERLARRTLRAVVFWRFVAEVCVVPRRLLSAVVDVLDRLENCVFYFELDAARRYHALTGIDLAHASGDDHRYADVVQ